MLINVASSPSARELFTLFDTIHLCNTPAAAGFISAAASFTSPRSRCSKSFASRITGMRSWISAAKTRGVKLGGTNQQSLANRDAASAR